MFDAATAPVAAVQPDPHRAVPDRVGKVLGLVHTLIAYGKNLADTLRRHAAEPHVLPCFPFLAITFATADLPLILARITRGLLRAAALEARLNRRAARGRDLKPSATGLLASRKPRAAKPAPRPAPAKDPRPVRPLSTEEILAKDRRRPIGAVLVDICLDLGIAPGLVGHATWNELHHEIVEYGGSLATFLRGHAGKRRPGSDRSRVARKTPDLFQGHSATADSANGSCSFASLPIAGPTIAVPARPAPSPQSPAPASAGPP